MKKYIDTNGTVYAVGFCDQINVWQIIRRKANKKSWEVYSSRKFKSAEAAKKYLTILAWDERWVCADDDTAAGMSSLF